ncbi:hypothetical protein G6F64_015300 [Rhizopus arrhizus]|uniref:Uncharacterized protein n=1 Tax=Rhizopus oryzae TaxID=64495 RepID=A0A9P6WRU9_RHIOR|nr:hypothetical protein G6F64_015300 [Rhizopus arrhizus]
MPARFQPRSVDRLASVMASTDVTSSPSVPRGKDEGGAGGTEARPPTLNVTIKASAAATGSKAQNASRQWPVWAKMPPLAGPHKVATPHMPATSAMARDQRGASNTSRISA